MFQISRTQHAVGHGGFHVGRAISAPDIVGPIRARPFTWIFDCGAKTSAKLDVFLKDWCKSWAWPVDWLFISHFDSDHVSGLQTLMSRTVVENVMVPYVNETELIIAMLGELDRDRLEHWFVELVADPAGWLLARGAGQVIFLQGSSPDELPAFLGELPARGPDGRSSDVWSAKLHTGSAQAAPEDGVQVIQGPCEILATGGGHSLRLKPYREPVAAATHAALLADLTRTVGSIAVSGTRPGLGDLAFAIARHARTSTGRKALQQIFKTHVGSSNAASLSLLSIPVETNGRPSGKCNAGVPGWFRPANPGWLNTGDAELLDPAALARWARHYAAELSSVGMLAIPHHGSDHNSDVQLQNLCPGAFFLAHVRKNASKHPGAGVVAAAAGNLLLVTGEASSAFRMYYRA